MLGLGVLGFWEASLSMMRSRFGLGHKPHKKGLMIRVEFWGTSQLTVTHNKEPILNKHLHHCRFRTPASCLPFSCCGLWSLGFQEAMDQTCVKRIDQSDCSAPELQSESQT